jgi:hypothetical protein
MRTQTNQVTARNSRTAIVQNLERRYAGMKVVSEPFDLIHPDCETREREERACARMKQGFLAQGIKALVVLTSVGAYVLRSEAGMMNATTVQLSNYRVKWQRCRTNKPQKEGAKRA